MNGQTGSTGLREQASTDEISDEELERRMRRKLFLNGPSGRGDTVKLSYEEQRIAHKLFGRENTERLRCHQQEDGRRFRPKPVLIHYEFYWFDTPGGGVRNWRVNRVENGRQEQYQWGSNVDELNACLKDVRAKGYRTKEVVMGFQGDRRRQPEASTSTRKAIINSLKDFRV